LRHETAFQQRPILASTGKQTGPAIGDVAYTTTLNGTTAERAALEALRAQGTRAWRVAALTFSSKEGNSPMAAGRSFDTSVI
jgi:hypothetical protein